MAECPTCNRDDFKSVLGVKYHHSRSHNESLVTVTLECDGCGDSFQRPEYDVVDAENYYCSHQCRKNIGEHSCPWNGCDYTSNSELGIKQHHKRTHGISLTKITVECDTCEKEFTRQRSVEGESEGTFCSQDCKYQHLSETLSEKRQGKGNPQWSGKHSTENVEVVCDSCGKTHIITRWQKQRTERNFCSRECYSKALSDDQSGDDNFNWRGGYEPYYGPNWHSQRRQTIERDNEQCQDCGKSRDEHYEMFGTDLEVHHKTPIRTFEDTQEANKLRNLITVCKSCHVEREHS